MEAVAQDLSSKRVTHHRYDHNGNKTKGRNHPVERHIETAAVPWIDAASKSQEETASPSLAYASLFSPFSSFLSIPAAAHSCLSF